MTTRFGFVSTFPPTQCGLATFTAALRSALLHSSTDEGWVVRLVDAPAPRPGDEVVAQLIAGDSASLRRAAAQLNLCDVAIVQHEYGVYGGADGSEILHLLDQVRVPCVVVLHTVLTDPTPHQRQVLEAVIAKADAVVTMTMTARERLAAGYAVDMTKVCIIAHGAPVLPTTMAEPTFRTGQFTVLTWACSAPARASSGASRRWRCCAIWRPCRATWSPARRTRRCCSTKATPTVIASASRSGRPSWDPGSPSTVTTGPPAPWPPSIRSADVVLLPYDSAEQVTSGVLIEAVAAGKPVVATQFPHAREVLAGERACSCRTATRPRSRRRCARWSRART